MLCRDGNKIQLTQKEFGVASFLLQDQDKVYSRNDIISGIGDEGVTDRTIDVHICSLRKKIKCLNLQVQTVRGKGYRIEVA